MSPALRVKEHNGTQTELLENLVLSDACVDVTFMFSKVRQIYSGPAEGWRTIVEETEADRGL
jgi:hypothetical protein